MEDGIIYTHHSLYSGNGQLDTSDTYKQLTN